MIPAIVLVPDPRPPDDADHVREIAVRSLVWLVSAVVAGVVGDVTLAGPADIDLDDVADRVGCKVVVARDEAERLALALAGGQEGRVLVLRAGYHHDATVTDDLDAFLRRSGPEAAALILAAPETLIERMVPGRAPVVGILMPRGRGGAGGFGQLVRRSRRATRLRARATRIL